MPVRPLPVHPSLDHLKYQAKDLLKGKAARLASVAQRIREFHPHFRHATDDEIFAAPFRLGDAQLTIAREAGFASWARLKRRVERPTATDQLSLPHHERIRDSVFRRAVDLLDAGDAARLREYLRQHPDLARQRVQFEGGNYFQNLSLLQFVAENPIRHGSLPPNIVEAATVIIDAGAEPCALNETLLLIATGKVPRECGVQRALIDLLCTRGADPNRAALPAAAHGEFDAVHALIFHGAKITLPLASVLGQLEEARRQLPVAGADDRHFAFALAAQFGHTEIVRLLLNAGEDPNRYNPPGAHAHSTPLHQAAYAGHEAVVRLLIEHGARVDMKDILWEGTAAGWARHAGRSALADYLELQQKSRRTLPD